MIAISAYVAQHDRSSIQLRNNQVRRAISVDIRGDDRTRILQFEFAQTDRIAYVFKSLRAAIAPDAQFSSIRSLDNCRKIDPAIVIDIDGGESPRSFGSGKRQSNPLEMLAIHVPPKADAGSARMSDRNIHPSIFIEIEDNNAARRSKIRVGIKRQRLESAFPPDFQRWLANCYRR